MTSLFDFIIVIRSMFYVVMVDISLLQLSTVHGYFYSDTILCKDEKKYISVIDF